MEWKELVKTCILGTANRPVESDWKALRSYGFKPDQQRKDAVFQAAATYSLLRKAGRKLSKGQIPPAPLESAGLGFTCTAASRMHLKGILQSKQDELLFEFLELSHRLRVSPSPAVLPQLLDWGSKQPKWQSLLRSLAAPRGTWLAQWNTNWDYMQASIDMEPWELGKKEERLRLFRRWRQENPAEARTALEAIWPKESLSLKLRLLKMLKWGLSDADIPFLEQCLDESRQELRQAAADLLASLPNSPLIQRMKERCLALLDWKKGKLELQLPEKLDAAMQRDGVQAQVQWFQGGVIASRLGQMLAVVPPSVWTETWGQSAETILQAALKHEWSDYLLLAWAKAAARHRRQDWLVALFRLYATQPQDTRWERLSIDFCFEKLSGQQLNVLALEQLEESSVLNDESPVVKLLLLENRHWEKALSLNVIKALQKVIASDNYVFHWGLKSVLKRAAYAVAPSLQERLSQGWPEQSRLWHSWQMDVNDFLTTLQFRKDMRAALQSAAVA